MILHPPIECNNTNIYVMDDVLPSLICGHLIFQMKSIVEWQSIQKMPHVSIELWYHWHRSVGNRCFEDKSRNKTFKIMGFREEITITKASSPLLRHKDNVYDNCPFKLSFYLNDIVDAGTIFYGENDKEVYVQNKMGRAILFDINLEHASQKFTPHSDIKYVLGARPIIEYI